LASRYQEFLDAGVRIVAVSVDSPARQAAMIDKLHLPFALLSDPGGKELLQTLDAYDPDERGGIGRPGVFVVVPDGRVVFREIGRDFADRITEDELLEQVRGLGLRPTGQPALTPGDPQPGPKAMPVDALLPYCRGARFAAKAMGMRHPSAKADADRYVAQMDRYMDAVRALRERTGA
jgi:alkyl hydroperoxide reductase subunit AhpC